ncbi:MAG: PAS domain S-box protein [Deltaproteobacteria bacterium]|nr:PAS domain S-box protein [Deltaproteobacteria bacterium]
MKPETNHLPRLGLQASPWILLGGALILLLVVAAMALQDINREKENMSRILIEKGAAWIKAIEAGTRLGMRRMMRGEDQFQNLLEETAGQSDVRYVAVTDEKGFILAHNDITRKGKPHIDHRSLPTGKALTREHWRLVEENGQKVFEVYREFRPLSRQEMIHRLRRFQELGGRDAMGGHRHQQEIWLPPQRPDHGKRFIFVGLDISPFEQARKEDLKRSLIISSVLLLLGFGGYISIFWVQNYRAARRSLQESDTFTDEVVANLPVGLMATDRNGNIAFFNAVAERITGLPHDQAYGRALEDVLPPDWHVFKQAIESGRTVIEQEKECAFGNRKAVPVSVSAARITGEEGQFLGNVVILRDIADVRRLQEEIRRTEKLAALGGLAAGVAHEIRNPLSSIKGIATYFRDRLDTAPADKETAEVMIQEVDRLNRVISELLEFARPPQLKTRMTPLGDLVRHTLRLVQQDAQSSDIDLQVTVTPKDLSLEMDPDRFSQCLLNLYLNAIQAMENDGTLSIDCALKGENVILKISDTGPGISRAHLQHVFNPYFTTKPSGSGLGLAIAHKIVEAHQGRITVDSAPGQGTVFTITLPQGLRAPIHGATTDE